MFEDTDIIYEYNVHDALKDGVFVSSMQGDLAEVSRQHYKHPVYMTSGVWELMKKAVENPKWCNDLKGVWHDILWMSRVCPIRRYSPSQHDFKVIITGTGRKRNHVLRVTVQPHGSKDPAPCVVISLPEED